MTPEQREQCAGFRKELMAMQEEHQDLNKRQLVLQGDVKALDLKLFKWSEIFWKFYKQISDVNSEKEKKE